MKVSRMMLAFCAAALLLALFAHSLSAQGQPEGPVPAYLEDGAKTAAPTPAAPPAATTPDQEAAEDPVGTAGDVFHDFMAKDWRQAISGLVFLLMGLLARYRKDIPWFSGDRGGAFLLLLLSTMGGAGTAIAAAGTVLTPWFLLGSISTAVFAAGIRALLKGILYPSDGEDWLPGLKKWLVPSAAKVPSEDGK